MLIFTSDNGFFHGEHRVPQGRSGSYEPSIRVPLLIRAPGVPKGVHRRQPVDNVDLAPTILDFANATAGRLQDGVSLAPAHAEQARFRRAAAWKSRPSSIRRTPTRGPRGSAAQLPRRAHGPLPVRGVRHRRAGALRPAKRPVRAPEPGGQPGLRPGPGRAPSLLGSQANCAGKTCRARPTVKLKARCSSAQGRGQGQAAGGDLLPARQEGSAGCEGRRSGSLPNAPSGASWRRWSTSLDGRIVTLSGRSGLLSVSPRRARGGDGESSPGRPAGTRRSSAPNWALSVGSS